RAPRSDPSAGLRPALESGRGEPHGDAAAQGYSGTAARPAFQHSASRLSPRGAGAAPRPPAPTGVGAPPPQPPRMVEPSAGPAAPPVRGDRRPRIDKALS